MANPRKMHVHLTEAGVVEILPHPTAEPSVVVIFRDVEVHDWRYGGGDADFAKWTITELDAHADEADDADEKL